MRQTAPPAFFPSEEARHGVHYLSRQKQPSMFEILTWQEHYDAASDKQWLVHLKEGNKQSRFTEEHKYEKTHSPQQPHTSMQKQSLEKKHLRPRHIKHQLYDYGQDNRQVIKKETARSPPKKERKTQPQVMRLNQFNEQDNRQIKIRKQNIDKFDAFTRELPDSAFTTYFGKPAFAHYGFGTAGKSRSLADIKSHSVMPHAGKNHPDIIQSHNGALNKANVINLHSYVPREPLGESVPAECRVVVKEYYNVEIVKPDLINEPRFSNKRQDLTYRARTPRHDELNHLPKREYAKSPPFKQKQKKGKKKQVQEKVGDGLAFMNERDDFMREVKSREKAHKRLAYKVTECYPYDWEHETEAASTAREQKWKQIRPAGIAASRSANHLLHR